MFDTYKSTLLQKISIETLPIFRDEIYLKNRTAL